MTREEWLVRMVDMLRPLFQGAGHPLPARVRVSCGWPTRRALAPAGQNRTIGQCFPTECSADSTPEVFVSPCIAGGAEAAAILVHELHSRRR